MWICESRADYSCPGQCRGFALCDGLIQSLSGTASELTADEWQTIVRIREENKTVFVLLKESENAISGTTVLTADAQELVFVNVMGELSPEVLARVADDVPGGHALAYASASLDD